MKSYPLDWLNDPEQVRIYNLLDLIATAANTLEAFAYSVQNVPRHDDIGINRDDPQAVRSLYFEVAGRTFLSHLAHRFRERGPDDIRDSLAALQKILSQQGMFDGDEDPPLGALHVSGSNEDREGVVLDYQWQPPVRYEP